MCLLPPSLAPHGQPRLCPLPLGCGSSVNKLWASVCCGKIPSSKTAAGQQRPLPRLVTHALLSGPVSISASSGVPPAVVCTHLFLLSCLPLECAKTCAYKPGMECANMGSNSGPGTLVSGSLVLQQEGGLSQPRMSSCVLLELPASSLRVHRGHPHVIAVSGSVPWKVPQRTLLLH